MMRILFPVFLILFPVLIPAQKVGEAHPEVKNQKAVKAPELVGNRRQTFRIRYIHASDVLSIAHRVISLHSLKVVVEQGGGAGRKAPKEKNAPKTAVIENTLLVGDGVANILIVHGPPEHIQIIRDLIAAIDVDLDLKKKDPNANPGADFEKRERQSFPSLR